MKPLEIEAGDYLTVRVKSIKQRSFARWVTVELLAPGLEGPIATFRFNRESEFNDTEREVI